MARRKESAKAPYLSLRLAGSAPKIELRRVADLRPDPHNARRHDPRQIVHIAEAIIRFAVLPAEVEQARVWGARARYGRGSRR